MHRTRLYIQDGLVVNTKDFNLPQGGVGTASACNTSREALGYGRTLDA